MIKDIVLDDTLRLTNYGTIVGVDNLGGFNVDVFQNSVDWLPGGHFYGIEYKFWKIVVYLVVTGNSFTEVETKRTAIARQIATKKKHFVQLETSGGLVLFGDAVIEPPSGNVDAENQLLNRLALKFTFLWPLKANERFVSFVPSETVGLVIPFEVPLSFASSDETAVVSVTNNGNMWFYPEIQITGPVGHIVITNLTNGMELVLNSGLAANQTFVAKFDENFVYKINDTDATQLVSGMLPRLEIGENRFSISASGVDSNSSAVIKYWDYYYGL